MTITRRAALLGLGSVVGSLALPAAPRLDIDATLCVKLTGGGLTFNMPSWKDLHLLQYERIGEDAYRDCCGAMTVGYGHTAPRHG